MHMRVSEDLREQDHIFPMPHRTTTVKNKFMCSVPLSPGGQARSVSRRIVAPTMGAKAEAVEHGAAAAAVLVSGVERLVRCLGGAVMLRSTRFIGLPYGCSTVFLIGFTCQAITVVTVLSRCALLVVSAISTAVAMCW